MKTATVHRRTWALACLLVAALLLGSSPDAVADDASSRPAVEASARAAAPADAPADAPRWIVYDETPRWLGASDAAGRALPIRIMVYLLYGVIALICVYTVRHYLFTFNRLFGRQRHPYAAIDTTAWPDVTVLVPCHNEEAVIGTMMDALLRADYPPERLIIMPVNDRSEDRTQAIIDRFADRHPARPIRPFQRFRGKPGKAAALKDAAAHVDTEIILIFDADYVPGRDLIKHLVAPFLDPEVGAVMGRVVPVNTSRNLLTRLLDMERAGGYQVDQQARMNLHLVPQYGGTVGGVRQSALDSVGGWNDDSLTEDTDITCRLITGGWKIAYSNRYECYEEVPETWPVRIRQIMRWAKGHTDAAFRYSGPILGSRHLRWRERLDGLLLMGVYLMSPILLLGWALAIILFYLGVHALFGVLAFLAVASYNTIGNFAAFYEIAAAARLDGSYHRIRLLPLVLVGFLVSVVSTSRATLSHLWPQRRDLVWDKTERYRRPHGLEIEHVSTTEPLPPWIPLYRIHPNG